MSEASCREAPARRDLLSRHVTIAKFTGLSDRPCRFRTALCPDRCGHASTTANFTVLRYLQYEKWGEYADEQATEFFFDMKKGQGTRPFTVHQDELVQRINLLQPGDSVQLSWMHEYVHQGGASFPERPVTQLEALPPGQPDAAPDQP
ncbi:hypothetical protein QJQ45_012860 [Haematococcus lacustris]|nr:hypothetical protein QJQ45_012860 [Haematococcus lacustris]